MTSAKNIKAHQSPPPPLHDSIRLVKGPLHGQRLRVQRQAKALLYLLTGDGRQATYAGDTATGQLQHQKTFDRPSKRRVRPATKGAA
jgi:hypothetical protein